MSGSAICRSRIENRIWWSTLAKNLRISHFKTQQVRVLFFDTLYAKLLNRLIALCVPFPRRQE